jgi:hypothetical protein
MKKGIKKFLLCIIFLTTPLPSYTNNFQQNALVVVGAAMAIGGMQLLLKKINGPVKKRAPVYYQEDAPQNSLVTRRRSFTRSSFCKDETNPDFYQESKRILTRTLGIAGIAAGMYLILNGNEFLEKLNRAERAYTWMGHWKKFKDYVGSWFATAPKTASVS